MPHHKPLKQLFYEHFPHSPITDHNKQLQIYYVYQCLRSKNYMGKTIVGFLTDYLRSFRSDRIHQKTALNMFKDRHSDISRSISQSFQKLRKDRQESSRHSRFRQRKEVTNQPHGFQTNLQLITLFMSREAR